MNRGWLTEAYQCERDDVIVICACSAKRRKEKSSKGLRHFSMKVCEKVQRKGITSYNEVADELVAEFTDPRTMSPADVVRGTDTLQF